MQDLAVGTLAAGAADTAAAPLSTLRRLLQTGRGVQSLHLKAVELLDSKGRPVRERGAVKLVHVHLPPAQAFARLFGVGTLSLLAQGVGSVTMGVLMVVFSRVALALVGVQDLESEGAGDVAALLAAAATVPLMVLGEQLDASAPVPVPWAVAGRALQGAVAAGLVSRSAHAAAWDRRARWSSLKSSTLLGLEGASGWAVAVMLLHALVGGAAVLLDVRGASLEAAGGGMQAGKVGKGGGKQDAGAVLGGGGWRVWMGLKVVEFVVRGAVLHLGLMTGHRGLAGLWRGLSPSVLFPSPVAPARAVWEWVRRCGLVMAEWMPWRQDRGGDGDGAWGIIQGHGVREQGFRTLDQAKQREVGENEILVFDVPYDDEAGVSSLPCVHVCPKVSRAHTCPCTHTHHKARQQELTLRRRASPSGPTRCAVAAAGNRLAGFDRMRVAFPLLWGLLCGRSKFSAHIGAAFIWGLNRLRRCRKSKWDPQLVQMEY